ncbi:MAG: biotin carboxylase N-terminal domain-containing protein [Microthrixaceae bacterium]
MIKSVLVANRGEIARRVFRTCRDLGIGTVAVHSDSDAASPYVREADAAVHLPGDTAAETYLRIELLIDAAQRSGADAVHPGYGFLSESAEFAEAVQTAGLTWIGPSPQAIRSMGSKIESKKLMADAGVPVLQQLDPSSITEADLPVLIKASAGGGGRGMRIVSTLQDLPGDINLARAEAQAAFGDPTVFCEPYLVSGHHVEVQVMGDASGAIAVLGERECSIQRRHQKVVEESPSPLLERIDGVREAMFEAARKAGEAISYVGAGTVEFIADDQGRFFFLEMNTRLQVEHPVTEMVTGLDLVALQIQVAQGQSLELEETSSSGHSIEVRLYAEDPSADYRPSSGTLHRFELDRVTAEFNNPAGAGVRLDSGVESSTVVGTNYDPMLAKVISWAPGRGEAIRRLRAALESATIHGLVTNRSHLVSILGHDAFAAGLTDTGFLVDHHDDLVGPDPDASIGSIEASAVEVSAIAAALAMAAAARRAAPVLAGIPSGWRNVRSQPQVRGFRISDGATIDVAYELTRDGLNLVSPELGDDPSLISAGPGEVVLEIAGVRESFRVSTYPGLVCVDSRRGNVSLVPASRFPEAQDEVVPGSLLAPMPGSIVRLAVEIGQPVSKGDPLMWLEAMKMQHEIRSPSDGVVEALGVSEGQQVEVGAVLAIVADASPTRTDEVGPNNYQTKGPKAT